MANKTISALPAGSAVGGADLFESEQGGVSVKQTTAALATYINSLNPSPPTGANPTATASDTVVNGVSTSFMRADAAPPVQKGSNAQFGLVKGDGSTVNIAAGVASAVQPAGANPTATASDTVVNGVSTSFMRADAAPPVQKGSNAQFGLVMGDGTTFNVVAGVGSAVQPTGANPTATASDTVVNGSSVHFMRADAAPPVQKGSNSQFGLVKGDNITITILAGVASIIGNPLVVNGINFGQQTLSDYEENTWTPTDGSAAGLTFTVARATYTRIGRQVLLQTVLTYPSTADGSNAVITGIPYNIPANATSYLPMLRNVGVTNAVMYCGSASPALSSANIGIYNSNGVAQTNATMSGKTLYINVIYPVT